MAKGPVDALVAVGCAMLWAQAASAGLMALGGVPFHAAARLSVGFAVEAAPFAAATLLALRFGTALLGPAGPGAVLASCAVAGAAYAPWAAPHEGGMAWVDALALALCVGVPLGLCCGATCLGVRWANARTAAR